MPSTEETKLITEKILQSKDFKDSPVYSNLLTYLVQSAESNNIPKETTIAIEVFDKDIDFNSNKDSTVRYHIHILRKKLDDYYKNDGKKDKIRLIIPKGHYEIKFISMRNGDAQPSNLFNLFSKHWKILLILIILVSNLIWILYLNGLRKTFQTQNIINPNDEIWGSYFVNSYPVSIIIGDVFLLDEYCQDYQRYRQIQDWDIITENDLNNFLIQYPNTNLWKSEITGIPFGGVNNLMDILPVIYQFQNDVNLRMSSSLSLEEIRNHNIIYIGELCNLRMLDKIISKTPIRYQYRPDERLFIVDDQSDTLHTFIRIEAPYEQKDKYNVDYSVLIKIPGFTNENFMFIVGFGYGGRIERTKMLGDIKLRSKMAEDIRAINQTVPEYFIAVFEVKSIERTGFTDELKYFQEISGDFFNE
ncbi:hypothetical protein ACFL4L_02985 [bacterium]